MAEKSGSESLKLAFLALFCLSFLFRFSCSLYLFIYYFNLIFSFLHVLINL